MPLSNKEKQAALRFRKAELGQKEMRGIWVTDDEEKIIKNEIRQRLKELRKLRR